MIVMPGAPGLAGFARPGSGYARSVRHGCCQLGDAGAKALMGEDPTKRIVGVSPAIRIFHPLAFFHPRLRAQIVLPLEAYRCLYPLKL